MVHLEMIQESSLCQESCPWTPCVMFLGPSWTWIYLGLISCSKKYLTSWTFLKDPHIDLSLLFLVWGRWFTLSHYRWSIVGAGSSFFQSLLSLESFFQSLLRLEWCLFYFCPPSFLSRCLLLRYSKGSLTRQFFCLFPNESGGEGFILDPKNYLALF